MLVREPRPTKDEQELVPTDLHYKWACPASLNTKY